MAVDPVQEAKAAAKVLRTLNQGNAGVKPAFECALLGGSQERSEAARPATDNDGRKGRHVALSRKNSAKHCGNTIDHLVIDAALRRQANAGRGKPGAVLVVAGVLLVER